MYIVVFILRISLTQLYEKSKCWRTCLVTSKQQGNATVKALLFDSGGEWSRVLIASYALELTTARVRPFETRSTLSKRTPKGGEVWEGRSDLVWSENKFLSPPHHYPWGVKYDIRNILNVQLTCELLCTHLWHQVKTVHVWNCKCLNFTTEKKGKLPKTLFANFWTKFRRENAKGRLKRGKLLAELRCG